MDDDDSARNTARERLALTRLLALSDGVFAIALTVLALSLDVPADTDANELGDAIRAELPQLVVYGVSFVAIAMFWLGHHRLYDMVANVDTTLLVANLFGLGLIALIPFPTEV
ncbi:MAG TPA: TMEM175 family protein, partial [Acidimicrobiales bacterium]